MMLVPIVSRLYGMQAIDPQPIGIFSKLSFG